MHRLLVLLVLMALPGLAAAGWAAGGVCHATEQRAAEAFCAAFTGVTSVGAQQCTGATVSGSNAVAAFRVARVNVDGSVTNVDGTSSSTLTRCEYTAGLDYWAPIISAFLIAGVAIRSAKTVLRLFERETY